MTIKHATRPMQAITTEYKIDTNGNSVYLVRCPALRRAKRIYGDLSLSIPDNHIAAANSVASKLGWLETWRLATGVVGNNTYCHVLVSK